MTALCDKAIARACVRAEYAKMTNEAAKRGETLIYPSQERVADDIVAAYMERNVNVVTLCAPPQWGKTGSLLSVILKMCDAEAVHPDNVFVLTGMSDKDWLNQTKGRMLPSMRDRVIHRNQLKHLHAAIHHNRDMLLVIDECHFASDNTQTLYESLKEAGIWDINVLAERNVRVLCVSATPGSMLLDAQTWGDRHATVVADAAATPTYTSFTTLLEEGRVHNFTMKEPADVERLCARIVGRWPDSPRWHIIRASNKELARCGFADVVVRHGFGTTHHNSARRIADIDKALKQEPAVHHFILIRGFWRAAATLDDRYIGVCYDISKDYSTTAQGLGGRLCGHGRQRGDAAPVLLTNKTAVLEYVNWLRNGCNYFACKRYQSASLTMVRGVVRKAKISTMHPSCVDNLEPVPLRDVMFRTLIGDADEADLDAFGEADGKRSLWLTEPPQPLPGAAPIPERAAGSAYRVAIQELLRTHLGLLGPPQVQVAYTDKRAAKFNTAVYVNNPTHYECDYCVGTATVEGAASVVYVALKRRNLAAFRRACDDGEPVLGLFHTFDGNVKYARKE